MKKPGKNDIYLGPEGQKLIRVTKITGQLDKPALLYWAVNCYEQYMLQLMDERMAQGKNPDYISTKLVYAMIEAGKKNFRKVSQDALDVGSSVHDAIHLYLQTGEEPGKNIDDRVLSAFVAFLDFMKEHKMETRGCEVTLYGDGYAGTCDWYGLMDGERTIVDWKSSKGIYDEYKYQIAAYRRAFNMDKKRVKSLGGLITRSGILRLDKETGLPEWEDTSDSHSKDEQAFLALLSFYHLTHNME